MFIQLGHDKQQAGPHIILVEPRYDCSQVEAVAERCASPLETPSVVAAIVQGRSYENKRKRKSLPPLILMPSGPGVVAWT